MKDIMCRYAFYRKCLFDLSKVQFTSLGNLWNSYETGFVRLPVTNAWNCHSLNTAFSSNVGAWLLTLSFMRSWIHVPHGPFHLPWLSMFGVMHFMYGFNILCSFPLEFSEILPLGITLTNLVVAFKIKIIWYVEFILNRI